MPTHTHLRPSLLLLPLIAVALASCGREPSAKPEPAPVVVPDGTGHLAPPDHATPPPSPLGPEPTVDAHGVPATAPGH